MLIPYLPKKFTAFFYLSFLIVSLLVFTNKSYAQCPPNIDFEYGNFTNWTCYIGYVDTTNLTPTGNPITNYHLFYAAAPVNKRQTMIVSSSVPSVDPYGGFPTLCPNGSGHSIRLGNDSIGGQSEAVNYKFRIPVGQNLFNLVYQYAVVLENPKHAYTNQPRVKLEVSDSATGLLIQCASYDFIAGSGLPGFYPVYNSLQSDTVWCKGWTAAAINLKGYGGKTINLTFITNDCTQFGHFGYAYIDVNSQCGNNAIINAYCWNSSLATLAAPAGFQHYHWYDSTLTTSIDTVQNAVIPLPPQTKWYGVICTPYPGYGCVDTFYTKITPVLPAKPTANFSVPSPYCGGSIINFTDLSTSNISGVSIVSWKWKFGDPNATGSSAPPNPDSSLLQNPQHYYSAIGNYTVQLIVTTSAGCVDTILKTIHITLPPPTVNITVSNDTLCAVKDTTTLTYTGSIPSGYSAQWSLNRGASLISGSLNSASPIVVSFDTVGLHYVGFTVIPPSTNPLVCWAHKNIPIYVKGFYPSVSIVGSDTVCLSNVNQLEIIPSFTTCGASSVICNSPTSFKIGNSSVSNTFTSPFYCYNNYPKSRSQYLYTATELNTVGLTNGTLKAMSFNIVTKSSGTAFRNFSIKMACVPYSSIYNGSGKFDTVTTTTLVYTSNAYTSSLGINKFNFTTPYNWDGVSNLLVEVCFDNTGFTSSLAADAVYTTTLPAGNYSTVYALAGTGETEAGCSRIFPQTTNGFTGFSNIRPDVRFYGCNSSYTPTGTTYSWTSSPSGISNSSTSINISPTTNTTYFLTANNNGCIDKDTFKVAVLNSHIKAGNDTTLCFSTNQKTITLSSTVSGTGPFNYSWTVKPSSAAILTPNIANPTVIVLANTIDTFVVKMTNATCTIRDTMIVYASANPTITKTKDTLICLYDTVHLSLVSNQANTNFSWTSPHDPLSCYTCYNPTSYITQTDTFYFIGTNKYGCSTSEKIKVTAKPIPTATFTATSPVCPNANSTLTYTGNAGNGATYNWNFAGGTAAPGGTLQGPQSVHWAVSDTYNIVLSVTKNKCTSLKDTQSVIVLPIPSSTFTTNNAHCVGDTLVLTYTGNGASIPAADPLWTIPASATIINGSIASFGPITLIPAVGSSIYSLTVNNGSCSGIIFKDTIAIYAIPNNSFTVTTPVCPNTNSTITYTGLASNSAAYHWNFDGGTAIPGGIVKGPHTAQWNLFGIKNVSLYVVENGCTSSIDTQQVQVLQAPTALFSKNNVNCIGDTLMLIYTGNGKSIIGSNAIWSITPTPTYLAGNGTTMDTILFIPAVGKTLINLTVENGICAATKTDSAFIYNYPTNTFTTTSPICLNLNSTVSYTGSAGISAAYHWNFDAGNAIPGGTFKGPHTVQWNSYGTKNISLSVTENGCTSAIDTVPVQVLQLPTATFTKNSARCNGDTLMLIYTGNGKSILGSTASWSITPKPTFIMGDTTTMDTILFVPAIGKTNIELTVTNNICSTIINDSVTVYSYPTTTFTATSPICPAANSILTYIGNASLGATFHWNYDGGNVGINTVSWNNSGSYFVSLSISQNGCTTKTDSIQINVLQIPTTNYVKTIANCSGDTISLIYKGNAKSIAGSQLKWRFNPLATYLVGDSTTMDTIQFIPAIGSTTLQLVASNGSCFANHLDTFKTYPYPTNTFILSTDTACSPASTIATYTGSASASAIYNWNFNSLTTSPGGNTIGPDTILIPNAGDYIISLSVAEHGCTSSISYDSIHIIQSPTASIHKNTPHCLGDTLQLYYSGTPIINTPIWSLPPSAIIVKGNINSFDTLFILLDTGMNHISVTANDGKCTNTVFDSIRIFKIPTSTFTINPTTNCTALASTLTYTGNASNAATYNWNFASGTATPGGTVKNQSVVWNVAGNYNVVLSVSENGCTSILDTQAVNVLLSPTSTFTKNNPHCAGDTLVLNYTGNAAAVVGANALWNIPSGATLVNGSLNSFSPIKVILPTGMNHFGMTITNSICTSTSNDSIRIYKIPTSTFTINPTTNCTALASTLTYTGNASNAATYNWNFASGTATPGGTTKNQSVIWNAAGNYNVVLSVSENGCTSILDTQAVNVLLSPTSTFTKNNPHCAGDTLVLNYTGNAAAVVGANALWNIPSGATLVNGSLNSFSPIKVILPTGMNHFGMTITNSICTSTSNDSIRIYKIPTSTFTINPTTNCTALASTLTYTGNASNAATYNWNFASGTATPGGTTKNQSVIWNAAGNYNVVLSVSENGCTSILDTQAVNVLLSPTSTFTKNNPNCAGDTLVLNYTGNAAAVVGATALWNIPTGATLVNGSLNSFSPIKVILPTGMNHIGLTITNSICTSTSNDSIRIYKIPTSTFTINPTTNCTALASTLTYTGNASNAATYNWNFASGTATPGGTTKNQSVIWNAAGNYNVVLSVSENGCTSILDTQAVNVLLSPTSTFTKNNPHCAGDTLTLTYTGNGTTITGASALWSFTNNPTIVSGSVNSFGKIKLITKSGKTVILMKVTNGSCITTLRDSVIITAIPTNSFQLSSVSPCVNAAIILTYNGNAPSNATYNWGFNGGNATPGGTVKGPQSVLWTTAGTKTVSLQVVNNGCSSAAGSAIINVVPIATTSFTISPLQICSGSTAAITYTGSNTATAYTWAATGTHIPASILGKGPHNVKWTNNTNANSKEMVILKVMQNGCLSLPDTNYITVVPIPVAAFTTNSPICPIDTIRVHFSGSNNTIAANYYWNFSGNSYINGNGIGPYKLQYPASGNYVASLFMEQNNCVSDTFIDTIKILPQPIVVIKNDTTICMGSAITLTATGASSYVWDNNLGSSASIFVHPTTTTTYKVVGTNGSCSGSDEATVKVSSYPMAYAGRDTMIPINSYIDLGTAATVGYHYSWNNAASLSNSYISNPIATPSDSTMYIVTVSNNDGCATTDTVIILVGRCYHLAIANTFTPNGDGENDNFRILNPRQLLSLEKFDIYNRWGEKVFSANDIHNAAWDGTYKGVMQEIGTYVYIIQATCLTNEPINLKGSVELVR